MPRRRYSSAEASNNSTAANTGSVTRLWRCYGGPSRGLYATSTRVSCRLALRSITFVNCNYTGALKMLRRGLPRLRDLPEICQGLHVAELHRDARAVHDQVVALGPDHIAEFDTDTLPRIVLAGCVA